MKKFTSLLIGCSIALASAAWAQQPEAASTPEKKKNKEQSTEQNAGPHQPGANPSEPKGNREKPNAPMKERRPAKGPHAQQNDAAANEPQPGANAATPEKNAEKTSAAASSPAGVSAETGANATAKQEQTQQEQTQQGKKGMKNRAANANAKAPASPASTPATAATAAPATGVKTASAPATGQAKIETNAQGKPKKVEQTQVEQIKTQHATFKAQAKPQAVKTVTFNENYRIQEAQNWTGPQYEVFRVYRPERHDAGFYRSRYGRVELIGGGYYYFNNGYWYPAWGYNPSTEYYAYDGPIYVGHQAKPWDQVIADVQAELQQMGYYRGEVDGLLGPLTREALTGYQNDQGLATTAAIDEPTLDSLGLS